MSELVNGGALVPSAEEGPVSGKGGAIAISSPRLVRLSPNGEFLASAQKRTLTIRVVATYEVHVHVRCSDDVQALAWSPDSELISCSITKRASVEVRLSLPIVVWGGGMHRVTREHLFGLTSKHTALRSSCRYSPYANPTGGVGSMKVSPD